MPYTDSFLIQKDIFDRRTVSELQHRIRPILKCYSVSGFKLIGDNSFEFQKSHSKMFSGKRKVFSESKIHQASYTKSEADDKNYLITVTFHTI